jgi:hypothetical protein
VRWLLVAVAVASGCFREASHPPLPEIVNAGGPVLASPRWAVITFDDDPLRADVEQSSARSETASTGRRSSASTEWDPRWRSTSI